MHIPGLRGVVCNAKPEWVPGKVKAAVGAHVMLVDHAAFKELPSCQVAKALGEAAGMRDL